MCMEMNMNKPTLGLAALLMLSGAVVAHAQDGPGDRMEGPERNFERGPSADGSNGAAPRDGDGSRGEVPGEAGPQAEGPGADARKGAADGERRGAVREGRSRSGDDGPDAGQARRKSADDANTGGRKARAEPRDRAPDTSVEDTRSKRDAQARPDADKADRTRSRPPKDAAEADEAKPADGGKQAERDRRPPADVKSVDLSGDKRERVGAAFRGARDVKRRSDVDIHISVGTRLPRDWEFAPVPVAVVEVVPEYRGYVFAYVEDEYVICDPVTYEVVAVLPASGAGPRYAGGGGGADRCSTSLSLTEEEREDILRSIRMTDEVDVSDITIGWSVPGDIALKAFPEPVISRTGKLEACRYFLAEDQIAIVDPEEEAVVLLIDKD